MPRITRFGHDRSSNLRVAPDWLSPEKVGRLIGWMDGIQADPERPVMAPIVLPVAAPLPMDPADVPAVLRPDCEAPEPPITAPVATNEIRGKQGFVIIDEFFDLSADENGHDAHSPQQDTPGASGTAREAPSAVSSGTAEACIGAGRRRSARAPFAPAPDQPVANNRKVGGQPRIATVEKAEAGTSDRLATIRAAAERLEARRAEARPEPRPSYAPSYKPESQISGKPDWVAQRHERLASAIAYLKARCILVSIVNRDALIRTYRMSGNLNQFTAEQVIARAEKLGWEASK